MKLILWFSLVLTGITLSGCSLGTRSDFECNATSSDSCMTMDQANDKARAMTESSKAKPATAAAGLPPLANLSQPLPSPSLQTVNPSVVGTARHPLSTTSVESKPFSSKPANSISATSVAPVVSIVTTSTRCLAPRCDSKGETTPIRGMETTAQLWVAPYIDDNDVYHQPGKVLFVISPGYWGQPRSVY